MVGLLWSTFVEAGHEDLHLLARGDRGHQHHPQVHVSKRQELVGEAAGLQKRGTKCEFPSDAGLVAITPGAKNAGWALSPDQSCEPDSYCPYACPPGQLMAQWDPSATSYTYPQSLVSCVASKLRHAFREGRRD